FTLSRVHFRRVWRWNGHGRGMPRPYGKAESGIIWLMNRLLRNELGSGFAARGGQFHERIQSFVEGAFVGGLIAQEKGELLGIDTGFGKGLVLQPDGALR